MNRIFALFIICMTLYACKPGIPKDIIQPDKMEKVLFDIHTVDGYIGALQKPDTAKIVASSYYAGVYKKFDIDSATFEKSKNYYYTRPDLLDKMYKNLMKQFEQERKNNDKRLNEEALAQQRKEMAKNIQVLAVPDSPAVTPTFTMGQNPFTLFPPLLQ
ncbi:DUF4296 domain-containing protein [Pedobacter sp. Du54]|uniref:DUF4296 domain-containing protein n=1 Tax=Pedobacter anseongensis TaxID=3133439 RepID=UPI0030B36A20